jgi:hypothetical protein
MAYPKNLPPSLRRHWDRPWTMRARNSGPFRSWLDQHGYLTPHFPIREAACKDGTPVTGGLRKRARDHAFNLERLRHELGDVPIPVLSWYRTQAYNKRIGGASRSLHMQAVATDHPRQWVNRLGRRRVLDTASRVFARGGMGIYPWGAIHVDTRGHYARWSTW